MVPIFAAIAVALAGGLIQVGGKLIDKGMVEPALEPTTDRLKKLVQRGYRQAKDDQALLKAVQTALAEAGAPAGDEDALVRWLKGVGLDRLTSQRNDALRRQVARAVLAFTDPEADPPYERRCAFHRFQFLQVFDAHQRLPFLRACLKSGVGRLGRASP
jgi:hypothetical protein